MDSYECQDNLTLMMEKPCLQFFNSTVTPSIMEFYPLVGVKRDVSSKPEQDLYALRGLLGVRYIMMPLGQSRTPLRRSAASGVTPGPFSGRDVRIL